MSDKEQCEGKYVWDGAHEEVCSLCDRSRTECELRNQIAELEKELKKAREDFGSAASIGVMFEHENKELKQQLRSK